MVELHVVSFEHISILRDLIIIFFEEIKIRFLEKGNLNVNGNTVYSLIVNF